MPLNVLIVDDSSFFQRRLKNIINEHSKFNVIGVADNGREAIEKVKKLKPDIVTMDYEMPMLDGVSAVRAIMAENPLPILMLSSMTYEGARITLDALEAGAMDFMTKNFSEISTGSASIKKRIYDALLTIGAEALKKQESAEVVPIAPSVSPRTSVADRPSAPAPAVKNQNEVKNITRPSSFVANEPRNQVPPKIVVIGASTGGPSALTELLKNIPGNFKLPILLVQHMPETFTSAFAERLNKQCQLTVKEAANGDELKPGLVLLAPGGQQMIIDSKNNRRVKVFDSEKPVHYKPCVDVTFASASNIYGAETLGVVLTGMGSDGFDGAKLLKAKGASIWTQNEESCLIYGMPMAIEEASLSDESLDIQGIASKLKQL